MLQHLWLYRFCVSIDLTGCQGCFYAASVQFWLIQMIFVSDKQSITCNLYHERMCVGQITVPMCFVWEVRLTLWTNAKTGFEKLMSNCIRFYSCLQLHVSFSMCQFTKKICIYSLLNVLILLLLNISLTFWRRNVKIKLM